MPATCGACRFFVPTEDAMRVLTGTAEPPTTGQCHRWPPTMRVKLDHATGNKSGVVGVIVPDTAWIAMWPQLATRDWCGEFAPADQVPA